MSAPSVNFTISSNSLGQSPAGLGNVIAVVGVSSSGVANTPYVTPVPGNFVTNNGYGPGPQLAALIAASSGNPVVFIKATTVTPGAQTAVSHLGTGSSVMTITGNANDNYYLEVAVTVAGTIGVAASNGPAITVSIDGGSTIYASPNLGTASTYVIANTGLTLSFAAGTLVLGDIYTSVCTAPLWSDATVTSAISSLIGQTGYTVEDIYVTGPAASGDATSFNTNVTTLANAKIFTNIVCESRDATWGGTSTENEQQWMGTLTADFASFAATNGQVAVTAGYYPCVSPIDSSQMRRPLSFFAAARDADVAISVDLGRTADGPLAPLVAPTSPQYWPTQAANANGFIIHDEAKNPGFDGARFISAFTIPGLPGFYIVNPNTMATPGSNLNWLQMRHVLNQFMGILYRFFALELSSSVRVSSTTGYILPQDASSLEHRCNAEVDAGLVNTGDVSAASIAITRNNNILATHQLLVTGTIVPLAYLKTISITVQFNNPAITVI